jgi:hypothetical protein
MLMLRRIGFLLLLLWSAVNGLTATAQDATPTQSVTIAPLNYGQAVQDTITTELIFDWWQMTLNPGDSIEIQMRGYDGLEPLIGLLSPRRELVARSDTDGPAEINGLAVLRYRVELAGEHTIVATRNGNEQGTSTGSYELIVFPANNIPARENNRVEVEFRCQANLITTALVFQFDEETPPPDPNGVADGTTLYEWYRVTVFALDDFHPFIRARAAVQEAPLDCSHYPDSVYGSGYTLPDQSPVTITATEADRVTQLSLRNASPTERFGTIEITIGSLNGGRGRYIVFVEGLALQAAHDVDALGIRPGPLAGGAPLTIYTVGNANSRLDPTMSVYAADETPLAVCDDAGRGDCASITPFSGAGATLLVDPATTLTGDRFDAGVTVTPASLDLLTLQVQSRDQRTFGGYTLVFIGELPPSLPIVPTATPVGSGN